MRAFGKLPSSFQPGQSQISAREMNSWLNLSRATAAICFGRGMRGRVGRNGIALMPGAGPMPLAGMGFRRARVTGYSGDGTHYKGYLLDARDNDVGDEIELWCQKAVPDDADDIRMYWPRLRVTEGGQDLNATGVVVVPVTEPDGDSVATRWYFLAMFAPWCEDEARQGALPDFGPKPPFEPEPPGEPIDPGDIMPTTPLPARDDDLQTLIDQQRGGRPCSGCGDG